MISKRIKIFTFFIIAVFIASALYFAVSLIVENSKGSTNSNANFETITYNITNYANNYGLLTTDFIEKSSNLLEQYPYLSGITIQKNDESFFAYPINSSTIFADTNGNAVISAKSTTIKVFTKSVYLQNGENLVFNAAFNTILPDQIYTIGRRAFIAVLAGTLICLCVLIYLSMFENNEQTEETSETEDEFLDEETADDGIYVEIDEAMDDSFEVEADFQDDVEIIEETEIPYDEETFDENNETESLIDEPESEQQENLEPKLTEKEDPMGLFSSVTGFGWEQYLEPRLDSELIRATSSEQDVALFVINFSNLNKSSVGADRIFKVLFEFFRFRDMIFEYKEDCFAGIMVNMELEKALDIAEELFIKLDWVIKESNLNSKLGIGISTRTLRLVPGERLLSEAYQASIKALDEEVLPIVAFRVNAEQYKDYVAENL